MPMSMCIHLCNKLEMWFSGNFSSFFVCCTMAFYRKQRILWLQLVSIPKEQLKFCLISYKYSTYGLIRFFCDCGFYKESVGLILKLSILHTFKKSCDNMNFPVLQTTWTPTIKEQFSG